MFWVTGVNFLSTACFCKKVFIGSIISLLNLSTSFADSKVANSIALIVSSDPFKVSNVNLLPPPWGDKPNLTFWTALATNPGAYSLIPSGSTFLIFWTPLPAPIKARLNNAPSVPNFNLFFNLLNASSLPSLSVLLSIIVKA